MRRLAATLLLLACSGLVSGCGLLADKDTTNAQAALETFRGEGFRIQLPCSPFERTDSVPMLGGDNLTVRIWMCEDDVSAYLVSTMKLPKGVPGDLDGAAQGGADALNGTVSRQKKITFAGVPGREVRIESTYDGKPAVVFARILVHQRTLYQVQLVQLDGGGEKPPSRYRKVADSLSFK
jgi:hypothetical protein